MGKENPEILNDFIDYLLSVKSYSTETVKSYNIDLLLFFNFIKEYLNFNIEVKNFNKFILMQVKEADIIAYLVYCNYTRQNSAFSRYRKLMAIKCFFRWLFNNIPDDVILKNPAENIRSINKIERLPRYLNLEQARKIKNVFNDNNSRNPTKNNMIIQLFLASGIRTSELISIKIKDIDFKEKTIKIIGKGNKQRTAYFDESCKKALLKYLSQTQVNIDDYLFLNSRNKPYSRNEIYYICKKAFNLLNLDKNFSTHTLRHTSATLLYMAKGDILAVKEFLGHSSIVSTQIYTHLYNQKLKEAVEKNPLSNFGIEEGEYNGKEKQIRIIRLSN